MSTLTIGVTDKTVEWWFTFRFLHESLPRSKIRSVAPLKTSLLNGYGIRTDGTNWLWTVSGFTALTMTLDDGRRISLGTPEPVRLGAVIRPAREGQQSASDV